MSPGLSLGQVLSTGARSVPVLLGTLAAALVMAWLAGRMLGARGDARTLIGVGTAICGASAIAATDTVIGAVGADVVQIIREQPEWVRERWNRGLPLRSTADRAKRMAAIRVQLVKDILHLHDGTVRLAAWSLRPSWQNAYDGQNWAGDRRVGNYGISASPSAVIFNGQLYYFHQGLGQDGQLWYTSTADGQNFAGDQQVPNLGMSEGPSAVVDGQLYVFHQGEGEDGQLWCTSTADGENWAGDTQVNPVGMSVSPAAVAWIGVSLP